MCPGHRVAYVVPTCVHVASSIRWFAGVCAGHGVLAADPAWGAAFPLITSWLSGYAADDRIVATHFAGIRTFVDSQVRQLERGELTVRYGDWCSLAFGPETGCDDVKSPDIGMAYVIKGSSGRPAAPYARRFRVLVAARAGLLFDLSHPHATPATPHHTPPTHPSPLPPDYVHRYRRAHAIRHAPGTDRGRDALWQTVGTVPLQVQ